MRHRGTISYKIISNDGLVINLHDLCIWSFLYNTISRMNLDLGPLRLSSTRNLWQINEVIPY